MKKFLIILLSVIITSGVAVWIYCCSLINVHPTAIQYFEQLKAETVAQGYRPSFYVMSGKRNQVHNQFLARFGGAATQSRHLVGEAIDVVVLDVNRDGVADTKDVDIIYNILNTKIVGNKGGVGTYKNQSGLFNRQQVHFDCRGYRARWHR